jgi:NAD-dependent deacetylase
VSELSDIEVARGLIARAKRMVVLTGAGISTGSGIPDFRGPSGIWTKNPEAERLSTLQVYMSDPEVRRQAWRSRLESPAWRAKPNEGHFTIVTLQRRGVLDTVVTQNIDGLHQAAGTDPDRVVEIHGTMHEVVCMSCSARKPTSEVLERVRAGEEDPPCLERIGPRGRCDGILKSAAISFGQNLVAGDLERAERAASACDLLLTVGSSLSVYPAAGLVPTAHLCGARVVIVNGEPTQYDSVADVVVRGSIRGILPVIVGPD